MKLGMWVNWSL